MDVAIWDAIVDRDGLPQHDRSLGPLGTALGLALGLWLLSGLLPAYARADAGWASLTQRDGLLRSSIHALSPLPSGGMLIGTPGGLNVWDGERLLSYTAAHGLGEGYVTCAIAHSGQIWAGTWGGGLSALGAAGGEGNAWRTFRTATSPLPNDWISALASDAQSLWIATYGGGLAQWSADEWQIYTRANSPLPSDRLTALAVDATGGLWIGTQLSGLAHRDRQGTWRVYPLELAPALEITALLSTSDEIWVGTPKGLAILDPRVGRWRWFDSGHLPADEVTALALAADGGVWIGTPEGLAHWHSGLMRIFGQRDGLPHQTVSALGVDLQGQVWVGSYVRGLAIQGRLPVEANERLPVVLVHGWKGPDSDRLEDSEFWHLARWLREDGFVPYYATGISPQQTLHENATRLGEFIAEICRETGSEQVYLIGFSMGGLNSRAYLESSLYDGRVARAFFLGSPHRGEHLWLPFLIWERLAWSQEPSALELLPIQMRLFDRAHANRWPVPYTLVAGDARRSGLPTLFRELPPSDGLVSTWSALGVEGEADRHVTRDIHAWSQETILLDLPTLLLPRTTYDSYIRPYLFGTQAVAGNDLPVSASDDEALTLSPRTAFRTGTLKPGESQTLELPIDSPGRARFFVRWRGPRLDVELNSPDGRQIDADDALDDDAVEYLELSFADFAGYIITDTLPGPWQLTLAPDGEHGEPTQYVAYASLDSELALTVTTDQEWYQAGETLQIRASLSDPGKESGLLTMSCTVHRPDGLRETIRLERPSQTDGEGSPYAGVYRLPEDQGYYVLEVRALGRRDGYRWERSVLCVVGAAARRAILRPPHALQVDPIQPSGSSAQIGVSAYVAGDYLVSITLLDGEEQTLATIAHPTHLEPGEHRVTVPLSAGRLSALASADGLALGEILLLDISDAAILLDEASGQAPQTSAAIQKRKMLR
ncbi:MAG: alpha/beta fold hydrolase [Anaerolineae bacterium]|nr:alpha/beta fold hydrolase [Anaerolineae bacterium]